MNRSTTTHPLDPVTCIAVGEAVLDYFHARDLSRGTPPDVEPEHGFNDLAGHPVDDPPATGREVRAGRHLAEVLINRFTEIHDDMTERGYAPVAGPAQLFLVPRDGNGDITCARGRIIPNGGNPVIFNVDDPAVDLVVLGCRERPPSDLVGALSMLICLVGEDIRSPGPLISLLRRAVGEAREHQAGRADRGGHDTRDIHHRPP